MNRELPDWVERWLGVAPPAGGEGTVWGLEGAWPWAPWLTLLFAVLAVTLVVGVYSRDLAGRGTWLKALLIGVRLTLVGLLLLMIAQLVLSLKRTGLPYVAVVVDESGSMGIEDRYVDAKEREALLARVRQAGFDKLTRLNLAKTILLENNAALVKKLDRDYQLKFYLLSQNSRREAGDIDEEIAALRQTEANGLSTQLGRGLRTVLNDLRGAPPAALVLLSDGVTTEGESLAEVADYGRRKGVPFFTVGLGDDHPVRDIEVSDLLVDEVVFVDDIVQFEFNLTAAGYAGQNIEIVLRAKDVAEPIARTTVAVAADGQPQKVRLPYRPTEVGEFEYAIEVAARPEEVNADNNRQTRLVSVRKEQIRVLFAQAYPNFEFRYLKNMLERDSTIQLKTVLQDADPRYAEEDKSALAVFPLSREELFEYDVIIFGDVNPGFLSSSVLENLSDFVREKGGGLVLIAGPLYMPAAYRGTPLESLIPVDLTTVQAPPPGQSVPTGFQVQPTDLGLGTTPLQLGDNPAETRQIWSSLPPLYWFATTGKLRPAARVLAEHPTQLMEDGHKMPLLLLEYAGAGKVQYHAVDETWRWRYQVGDIYFARFWVQSIRYLSRSKLLGKDRAAELTADRREYKRGESARLRLRFLDERTAPAKDDGVTVVVQRNEQEKKSLTLTRAAASQGVFEGTLSQPVEGEYHAWIVTPQLAGRAPACDFLVAAPPGEFERLEMDRGELERAAKSTGGRFYTPAIVANLLGDLPTGRQIPLDALPAVPIWNSWPLLTLFLALLLGEWVIRKRIGLL